MEKREIAYSLIIILVFLLSMVSMQTSSIESKINPQNKSNSNQTRTDAWIEDLQANYKNSAWFFNHLNTTDRLLIRNAIDYAMPRLGIINSIANGFGSPLATYQLPETGKFFNSNVTIDPYNLPTAIALLTTVFGYTWSSSDNNSTPFDESAPYFPITIIASDANQAQFQSANLINGILRSIGIGSTLVTLNEKEINSKLFSQPPALQGLIADQGGFDSVILSSTANILPDDGSQWYGSIHIPNNNYQGFNSTILDSLIAQENNKSLTSNQRISYYYQMQQYVSDQSLNYILYQKVAPFIYNKNLLGFNGFYAVSGNVPYQNLSFSNNQNQLTLDLSSKWTNLNPLIANDTNSNYYINQLWAGGLLRLADQENTGTKANYSIYGNLAYNNFTISPNEMFYNFSLKSGLRWADGTPITAQDVAFTYHSILTPAMNALKYNSYSKYLNNQSIVIYDQYHIGFNLTKWIIPYPLAENLFTVTILPNATYSFINWKTDKTNTGIGLTAQAYNSNGPYQILSINSTTGSAQFKNSTWWVPGYASKFDAPAFNIAPKIPSINLEVSTSASTSLNNLVSGKIGWVDQQVGLQNLYAQILPLIRSGSISETNATLPSWVEFSLNQNSPLWGYTPFSFCYASCGCGVCQSSVTTSSVSPTITVTSTVNQWVIGNSLIDTLILIFLIITIFSFIKSQNPRNQDKEILESKEKNKKVYESDDGTKLDLNTLPAISCSVCGSNINNGDFYCPNCGNRL